MTERVVGYKSEDLSVRNPIYEVDGTVIELGIKLFESQPVPEGRAKKIISPDIDAAKKPAIVYLMGYGVSEYDQSVGSLCQQFADLSQTRTYAINPRAERVTAKTTEQESEAIRQILVEQQIDNLTIIGNSQGGLHAPTLISLLQEKNPQINIHGMVLIDAVGLYKQSIPSFLTKLALDSAANSPLSPITIYRQVAGKSTAVDQGNRLNREIRQGIITELSRSRWNSPSENRQGFVNRSIQEVIAMVDVNPYLEHVRSPVIIINAANDWVSDPKQIVHPENLYTSEHENSHPSLAVREADLKERLFPNSPSVQMYVGQKLPWHNMLYFRNPELIAKVPLERLARWHRSNTQ